MFSSFEYWSAIQVLIVRIGDWERPPNFLLVDYYNYGDPRSGSVFEVAARANGVQYHRKCCGLAPSLAVSTRASLVSVVSGLLFSMLLMW